MLFKGCSEGKLTPWELIVPHPLSELCIGQPHPFCSALSHSIQSLLVGKMESTTGLIFIFEMAIPIPEGNGADLNTFSSFSLLHPRSL